MTVFGMDDVGKFRSAYVDASNGRGMQISMPGGSPLGASSLVTSFSAEQRENFAVSQCLNGGTFLYTFGHDPHASQFSLGITSFLRTCSGEHAADFARALRAYSAGRVSQSKALSSLSVGDAVLRGYLVGLNASVVDAGLGIVASTYTFIALRPQEAR